MVTKNDQWNPTQYNKFKDQRSKPFFDLMDLIRPGTRTQALDLGCGTGELTQTLHRRFSFHHTVGIDSSQTMLDATLGFREKGLEFKLQDVGGYYPEQKFDLVFSNAALQWLPDHEKLMPRIFSWVKPGGQIALQMPYNFEHASHRLAREVALQKFPLLFTESETQAFVLPLERYAELLFENGFSEQNCLLKIYDHPLPSGKEVIEWTKGTTLTAYQKKLNSSEFSEFLREYSAKLLCEIGTGSYFYTFKRILLWGIRPS